MFKKIANTPIRRNIIANFFGVGVRLFNQVLLVPLYLTFWSKELYSDWIVISAISSFFAMSDIGLNSVTSNQFTINYAGDKSQCRSLLTNNYIIVLIIAIISLLGSIGYVSFFDITSNLGINQLSRSEASYIFVALIFKVFVAKWGSVLNAVYRANAKTDRYVYIENTAILSESIIILSSLITKLPMTVMVTLYLIPQFVSAIFRIIDTRKLYKYLFSLKSIDIPLLKKIFMPSISFMAFPAGDAIVYQGFTLVVNRVMGADGVVTFNTTRTLCNFMRQLLEVMQKSVWPEYSRAYGLGDIARMRNLHRRAFSIAIGGAVLLSIGLILIGPYVYELWTQGKVAFNYQLVFAFIVVLLVENMWITSSVCLKAVNKHTTLGAAYLISAAVAIGVAIFVANTTQSLPYIEYCLLIIHLPLSIYTINRGLLLTNDALPKFINIFSK